MLLRRVENSPKWTSPTFMRCCGFEMLSVPEPPPRTAHTSPRNPCEYVQAQEPRCIAIAPHARQLKPAEHLTYRRLALPPHSRLTRWRGWLLVSVFASVPTIAVLQYRLFCNPRLDWFHIHCFSNFCFPEPRGYIEHCVEFHRPTVSLIFVGDRLYSLPGPQHENRWNLTASQTWDDLPGYEERQ